MYVLQKMCFCVAVLLLLGVDHAVADDLELRHAEPVLAFNEYVVNPDRVVFEDSFPATTRVLLGKTNIHTGVKQVSSCTGVLIGSRTVLTAAHCVASLYQPDTEASIRVFYGSPRIEGQIFGDVVGVFTPREYDFQGSGFDNQQYDFAVLRLGADASHGTARATTIPGRETIDRLQQGGAEFRTVLTGYGKYTEVAPGAEAVAGCTVAPAQKREILSEPNMLKAAYVSIAKGALSNNPIVSEAAGRCAFPTGACSGDSGGPLYLEIPDGAGGNTLMLAGIVSGASEQTALAFEGSSAINFAAGEKMICLTEDAQTVFVNILDMVGFVIKALAASNMDYRDELCVDNDGGGCVR